MTAKSEVMKLARLACEQGASFDVTYEADGGVRVSLYPSERKTTIGATDEFARLQESRELRRS